MKDDLIKLKDYDSHAFGGKSQDIWINPTAVASVVPVIGDEGGRAHIRMKDGRYFNVTETADVVANLMRF
jgi:hypothetical protein